MMGGDVLDVEAAVDDAAWARRMAEAQRPPPDLVLCGACEVPRALRARRAAVP